MLSVYPFPKYNNSAADDFESLLVKEWNISINEGMIIEHIVAKGEIVFYEQFIFLPQCF